MPKSSFPGGWLGGLVAGWVAGLENLGIKLTQPSLVELGLGLSLAILECLETPDNEPILKPTKQPTQKPTQKYTAFRAVLYTARDSSS